MLRYLPTILAFLFVLSVKAVAQPAPIIRSVAIVPAHVSITLKKNENKRITEKEIKAAAVKMSFITQAEIHHWFTENTKKYHYDISLQDIKASNEKMFSGGLSFEDYEKISNDSLARMLNVDAVVFCNMAVVKTLSDGEAAGLTALSFALFGLGGGQVFGTASVKFDIGLSENILTGNLWPQKELPLSFSSPGMDGILIKTLKYNAKKFPYRKKK